MVKNFTVEDDVQLTIYGAEFSFDSTDLELLKKLDKFHEEAVVKADEMKERKDIVVAVKETIDFTLNAIDEVLGEGASLEIFKDTKVSLNKSVGVLNHISEEVANARMKTIDRYTPDRAKR